MRTNNIRATYIRITNRKHTREIRVWKKIVSNAFKRVSNASKNACSLRSKRVLDAFRTCFRRFSNAFQTLLRRVLNVERISVELKALFQCDSNTLSVRRKRISKAFDAFWRHFKRTQYPFQTRFERVSKTLQTRFERF